MKLETEYRLTVICAADQLATVIDVLAKAAQVESLSLIEPQALSTTKRKSNGRISVKHAEGSRAQDLVVQYLTEHSGPQPLSSISKWLGTKGLNPHTASAALSLAKREKKAQSLGNGLWQKA